MRLSQIEEGFFSPFSCNKNLAEEADVWKVKEAEWLVVAFDLLRSMRSELLKE
jgi:hypothetical protein